MWDSFIFVQIVQFSYRKHQNTWQNRIRSSSTVSLWSWRLSRTVLFSICYFTKVRFLFFPVSSQIPMTRLAMAACLGCPVLQTWCHCTIPVRWSWSTSMWYESSRLCSVRVIMISIDERVSYFIRAREAYGSKKLKFQCMDVAGIYCPGSSCSRVVAVY